MSISIFPAAFEHPLPHGSGIQGKGCVEELEIFTFAGLQQVKKPVPFIEHDQVVWPILL